MQTPNHWKQRGFLAELLVPLSLFYYLWIRLRRCLARRARSVDVPVVCVGNITAGGAGKTPVALALARHFAASGRQVAFLSRGYGGRTKRTTRVDLSTHDAQAVGDEPLLLAAQAPTYVGSCRYHAALAAIKEGADLLIMDDGLQHGSLRQDVRLLVVDGPFGFGNGLLLPAGPLRDTPRHVGGITALVMMGDDAHQIAELFEGVPVCSASLQPVGDTQPTGGDYVAFAGIGRPEKFFNNLRGAGYSLSAVVNLPDHHRYQAKDIAYLDTIAKQHDAKLITTEKDAVKLPASFREQVDIFPVEAVLEGTCFSVVEAVL